LISHNLVYENKLWGQNLDNLAGIDEVGRGPLAGPVVACAVIFDKSFYHPDVKDSKQLSHKRREQLSAILRINARAFSIAQASESEIDRINIRQASFLAMRRAVAGLQVSPDYLLIDGEKLPECTIPSQGIIKGDQLSFSISAASIIAKVARDRLMQELDREYPYYKFAQNKGYGTREHIQALKTQGPSPYHRKSFLTKILAR
jgi:ribonuclease HII